MRRLLVGILLTLLTGCAATRQNRANYPVPTTPAPPVQGIVYVANGAGDYRVASQNLAKVVADTGAPLQIVPVVWTLGTGRVIADQSDQGNHLAQGRKLAAEVLAYRQANPGRRVYLVGYSAGGAVALSAAEALPPDSLDGIVLLAPSVCATHDLRPALRASRSIDHYYSPRDRLILGLGMRIVGTTDADCRVAAGQFGFEPVVQSSADSALYAARLHQHAWNSSFALQGNTGGHFGPSDPQFLRSHVLPLFDVDVPPTR